MSIKIRYSDDRGRGLTEVQGSDGRLNVSSRSDSRDYYNSRDEQLSFALVWDMTLVATDEFCAYWRNASPDKDLIVTHMTLVADEAASFKIHKVTGTASAGTELTPENMNAASSRAAPDDAVVMAMSGTTTTPISGLTTAGVIRRVPVEASVETEIEFHDTFRLGHNNAVAVEAEEIATTAPVFGVIYGYYE